MENEYQVLSHLQENEKTSQRAIAEQTGLSLGAVNILIKKMVRKGLIKVEQLNSRTMRYILTPQGIQEKAQLTYSYILQSYRHLLKINHAIDKLITDNIDHLGGKKIIVYGPKDEVREIITQRLNDLSLEYEYHSNLEHINYMDKNKGDYLIITWRTHEEETASAASFSTLNIMKSL